MRPQFSNSNLACVAPAELPHHLLGRFAAPNRSRPKDATKSPPADDAWRCEPIVNDSLNPRGHWYGSNVTSFSYEINDGPAILATLKMINHEFSQFATPQATTQ